MQTPSFYCGFGYFRFGLAFLGFSLAAGSLLGAIKAFALPNESAPRQVATFCADQLSQNAEVILDSEDAPLTVLKFNPRNQNPQVVQAHLRDGVVPLIGGWSAFQIDLSVPEAGAQKAAAPRNLEPKMRAPGGKVKDGVWIEHQWSEGLYKYAIIHHYRSNSAMPGLWVFERSELVRWNAVNSR